MEDLASELLQKIRQIFKDGTNESQRIAALRELIQGGGATYIDAEQYAYEVGNALANALGEQLSSAVLPDGRMEQSLAESILRPLLQEDYDMVSAAAVQVQTSLNSAAGIGIKAQTAPLNVSRIEGIISRVSAAEQFDAIAWILAAPIVNFSQAVVDDTLKANVDFQGEAGLRPKIVRKATRKCCKWCSKLEGEYAYPDVPKDVYRRHANCRCEVDYDPGDGMRQDVWSKKWKEPSKTLEQRKDIVGVDTRAGIREVQTKNTDSKNVMPEYLRTATPGKGEITYEDGYDTHRHMPEIKTAQWLHDNLGGDIVLLNESKIQGQKTPDFIWRKQLWDLKTLSSEKAANSAVRHGLQQIRENPGGIILDFGNTPFSMTELEKTINKRMQWNQLEKADIIVIARGQIIITKRYQKK